ncbi:MAG: alpha-E domain-containing protein [Gammaproteobacteria bacterium]|nr:alpha-E domain-containing protein [Gammaproteobacteria bacterium]
MLSRTADHLFWMARYTERAENTARMLDVTMQTSLLPQFDSNAESLWHGMLGISELQQSYEKRYGAIAPAQVLDFMVCDPANPSSIYSCVQAARENARAVRGVLTTEVWETVNTTWLDLPNRLNHETLEQNPSKFFEWIKYRSHLTRGVLVGTMLHDEGFHFTRLGNFLERADNTARLLDVKYHALAEQGANGCNGVQNGNADNHQLEFYHWAAVLRSVSAFEVYRKVYSDVIMPARVAELLMLRADMPRSLLHCLNEVLANLEQVRNNQSGETERRTCILRTDLHYGRIDDILQTGLHAYLTNFLERVNDLGVRISRDFLVPPATP